MTPQTRGLVAVICLVGGIALFVCSAFLHDPTVALEGSTLVGPVIGYAFGDRNGEKRAASALAERGLDPAVLALLESAVRPKSDGDKAA